MGEPAVKGSLVLGAVVAVRRHRDQGRVAPEQLEARLSGLALELVDQKIDIARWYPVDAFNELLDSDWDIGGRRQPDYMRRSGERAADRLFQSGVYQQLRYVERAERANSRDELLRRAKLITSINGTLFNFLTSEVCFNTERPDVLEIHYKEATDFGEALRYSTEGFMNQLNKHRGSSRRWTSERVRPDLVVYSVRLKRRD